MSLDTMVVVVLAMVATNAALTALIIGRRVLATRRAARLASSIAHVTPLVDELVVADDPRAAHDALRGARGVRRVAIITTCAEYASRIRGPRRQRVVDLLEDGGYVQWLHRQSRRIVDWRAARACTLLGKVGSEASVEVLARNLDHGNLELRSEAAQALGRIGLPTCAPPLVEALRSCPPDQSIGAVFHAVMELGPPGMAAFVAALEDGDARTRTIACMGLSRVDAHLAHAFAVPERLAQVATTDPELAVRCAALKALGEIADPAGVDAVYDGMGAAHPAERIAAAHAARSFPVPDVLPGLLVAARDEQRLLAHTAGESLVALLEDPELRPIIERHLRGRSLTWGVRRAMLERALRAG